MKITILSENYVSLSIGLMAEHGFSVFIENNGQSFLFDTGQHGICVDNAYTLGCDLKKVDKILLSHGHYDHCGGLEKVMKAIGKPVEIIGHSSIFEKKYALTEKFGKKFIGIWYDRGYLEDDLKASFHLQDGFYEIHKGLWLTGEVPFTNAFEKIPDYLKVEREGNLEKDLLPDDNSLVLDSKMGLVVILGCAHRGMVNILSYVKKTLGKNIYAVVGGTHLLDASAEHHHFVKQFLREEEIQLFAPSHCTGIEKIMEFSKEFEAITKPAFCGTVIEI